MIEAAVKQRMTATHLEVAYEVRNVSPEPVFVCAVPIDASRRLFPGLAYASLSQQRQHLVLTLGFSEIPDNISVEVAICGAFRLLNPDESLHGTISLALPVLEWNAYAQMKELAAGGREVKVNRLFVRIAWIRQRSAIRARAMNDDGLFAVSGPIQEVVKFLITDEGIPVIDRGDDFPRSDGTALIAEAS